MPEVLTEEQLEELAAYLKGTTENLADGLAELEMNVRQLFHARIREALLDVEGIEQCSLCGQWTFSDTLQEDNMGNLVCADCFVDEDEDEDW